jgi:hypothetical protein
MALRFLNSGYFAGKVGIGVEAPLTNLDILGTSDTYLTIRNTGTFKSGIRMYGGTAGISNIWHDDTESSPPGMHFGTSTNIATTPTTQLYIKGSDGNIGIGTTTPNAKLDIQGTQGQLFSVTDDLSGEIFAVSDISGVPIMTVNSSGVSYFDGNVGIGVTNPGRKLSVNGSIELTGSDMTLNTTSAAIRRGTAGQMFLDAPGDVTVTIDSNSNNTDRVFNVRKDTGSELFRIQENGNVGIGTTSPVATFQVGSITATAMSQVVGKARIVGTNYIPSSTQMGTLDIASTTRNSSAPFNQGFGPSLTFSQNISGYVSGYEVVIGAIKSIVTSGSNTGQESAMTFLVNGGTATGVVERMRIAEDGNVGIGTTDPNGKLEVNGIVKIGNVTTGLSMNGSSATEFLISGADTGGNAWNSIHIKADGNDGLFIEKDTNNVGIGTTSPDSLLHVSADVSTAAVTKTGTITIEGRPYGILGDDIATIDFHNNGNKRSDIRMERGNTADDSQLVFSTSDTGTLTDRLIINEVGNVGIGTVSPAAGLQVALGGSIIPAAGTSTASAVFGNSTSDDNYGLAVGANSSGVGYISSQRTDGTATTYNLAIQPNGGNVSIGGGAIGNPGNDKLQVDGTLRVGPYFAVSDRDFIKLVPHGSDTRIISPNERFHIENPDGNIIITPSSAGGLGINTTSPDFKLDVDGTFGVSDLPFNTDSVSVLVADETIGAELITNGDFATNTDWTLTANVAISGGKLNFTNATTNTHYANQVISAPVGSVYKITLEVSNLGSGESIKIRFPFQDTSINANGTYTIVGEGTTANAFRITPASATATFSIDNVSVKLVTSASNQIQKRELGTGAFGPTPVGAYLPLSAGSGSPLTGALYVEDHLILQQDGTNDLIKSTGNVLYHKANEYSFQDNSNNGWVTIKNGNVGVGVTGPTKALQVDGSIGLTTAATTGAKRIHTYPDDWHSWYYAANVVNNISADVMTYYQQFLIRYRDSGNVFIINGDGNVGIGYTNPSEKLEVAGNIKIQSALLSNQENTDIDSAAAEVVAQVAHATYTAAFFDFVVKKGTNVRSGTVYACHNGDTTPLVEFTETSTNDLGDTSDVTLSVDISGANMRLLATVTSDDWSVKSLIRAI